MIWHIKNHYMPGHCEIILRIFTGRIPAYVLKTLFFSFSLRVNHVYTIDHFVTLRKILNEN